MHGLFYAVRNIHRNSTAAAGKYRSIVSNMIGVLKAKSMQLVQPWLKLRRTIQVLHTCAVCGVAKTADSRGDSCQGRAVLIVAFTHWLYSGLL
jgi:hypothetical protein